LVSVPVLAVLGRLGAAAGRVGVQYGGPSAAHQGGECVELMIQLCDGANGKLKDMYN